MINPSTAAEQCSTEKSSEKYDMKIGKSSKAWIKAIREIVRTFGNLSRYRVY